MAAESHTNPETTVMPRVWDLTQPQIVRDGLSYLRGVSGAFRIWLLISVVLGLVGVVALIIGPVLSGWGDRQPWTYVAVAFFYLMATVASAPIVVVSTRLTRGHWRRPMARVSEMWAAAMIVPFILFILLLPLLSGTGNRPSIWFGWWASPWLWDFVLMLGLVIAGYGWLYISSIPDFAVARDMLEQDRGGRWTRLARGFYGTERNWLIFEKSVIVLGVFYSLLYIITMTVLAADFIMSLVPSYHSAIFPAWLTISGFEGGIATVIVTATILRKWGGADEYLEREQFFALGKLQLAFGLLYFYFTWTDFIILWYGRMPWEINLLHLLYFNRYGWLFATAVGLNFLWPLFLLIWTNVRRSINGPFYAACGVLVGTLFDRIRYLSSSFSTGNVDFPVRELTNIPPTYYPDIWGVLVLIGMIFAAIAVVMLAFRVVPYPSIWEVTAGLWLRAKVRIHHVEMMIIGKPDY
ncbi:MAG TPA: hypothetical protein VFI42_15415 [Thermomicrobiaceae bacterium]|nr:hypothetical protein [Thermomicrobiaceae bacterium]